MTSELQFDITQRPDFALLTVHLQQGQKVFAEPSAMASMSNGIRLKAGFKGGWKKTLGRALGGESLIINTFTAETPGDVSFAAGCPGDTVHYQLDMSTLYLQRGAFMVHSEGVELSGKWGGAKGFFSGKGLVLLKATGTGDLFFNSYGALIEMNVEDEYIVDTGYVVAFEESLDYDVTTIPGMSTGGKVKSFFFGGEGLVVRFRGEGRVWIQSRAVNPFLNWVYPFRPVQKQS